MVLRILDTETTGVNEDDAIIEIASIDIKKLSDGEYTVVNPMQTFVDPGRPIPPEASAVHHLIDGDVAGFPRLHEAVQQFMGADAIIAHNAAFDRRFFHDCEIELSPTWICTYKCMVRLYPDFPKHTNQYIRYKLGLVEPFGMHREAIHPHRAASDVIVTAGLFVHLLKSCSWRDLQQWSLEPVLFKNFTVGKYFGKPMLEVLKSDPDYFHWMRGNQGMDEDIRNSLEHWLAVSKERK